MITYNDIYEAARKERYTEQLQPLAKNFIKEYSDYLRDKKQTLENDSGDYSPSEEIKAKKQVENANTLFNELMVRRRKKILHLVLVASETGISKHDFGNMLLVEKELFENLMKAMDEGDKKLKEQLHGKNHETENNEMIVFNEDINEFMSPEGEKMGPYKKGQLANIPKEVAKILLEGGKAEIVSK
ncbi:MAG TPA: hypothetical protein VJ912_01125 [Candidatus Nanoarchaeia archaeon]|nr:hypothetical protein [Candidatus Nanoarchaeia archaeon]